MGGFDGISPTGATEVYDPDKPELGWTFLSGMVEPRSAMGMAVISPCPLGLSYLEHLEKTQQWNNPFDD